MGASISQKTKFIKETRDNLQKTICEYLYLKTKRNNIEWCQYTPFFNDGDECTFGIYSGDLYLYDGLENIKYGLKIAFGDGVSVRFDHRTGKITIDPNKHD